MGVVDRTALPALGIAQPLVPLVDEFAAKLFAELDYVQVGLKLCLDCGTFNHKA